MTAATKSRQASIRTCIVSGEELPKDRLLRFVVDPTQTVMVDLDGKLPGRGLWLRPERDIIDRAVKENRFARAARSKVNVPSDLGDRVEILLRDRCLSLIGLAKKAGQLTGGFDRVRAKLSTVKGGVLLSASDGGADGRGKIKALAGNIRTVDQFDSAELGSAVGREKMVHAIIAPGKFAERMTHDAERLSSLAG